MPDDDGRFTCAVCGGRFQSDASWSEDERILEFELVHERAFDESEVSSVCDVCYPIIVAKAKEQGLLPS